MGLWKLEEASRPFSWSYKDLNSIKLLTNHFNALFVLIFWHFLVYHIWNISKKLLDSNFKISFIALFQHFFTSFMLLLCFTIIIQYIIITKYASINTLDNSYYRHLALVTIGTMDNHMGVGHLQPEHLTTIPK